MSYASLAIHHFEVIANLFSIIEMVLGSANDLIVLVSLASDHHHISRLCAGEGCTDCRTPIGNHEIPLPQSHDRFRFRDLRLSSLYQANLGFVDDLPWILGARVV